MLRSMLVRLGLFAVTLLPLGALASAEDPHFIEPTEVFVSTASDGWYFLARTIQPPSKTKKEGEFRKFNDADLWTEHVWRSRPAKVAELKVGQRVLYFRDAWAGDRYSQPKDKKSSRTGYWMLTDITDLLDTDRGFAMTSGKQRVALSNIRIPLPFDSVPVAAAAEVAAPKPTPKQATPVAAAPKPEPKPAPAVAAAPVAAPEPVAVAPAKKAPPLQPEKLTAEQVVEAGIEYMMSEYALDVVTYTKCGMDLAQKKDPANFELVKTEFLKVFPKDVRKKLDLELMGPDMVELKRQLDERGIMRDIKAAEKSGNLSCDKGNRKLIQWNMEAKKRWLDIKRQL